MTTQTDFPVLADLGARLIGDRAALLENVAGGKVFINGQLAFVWEPGQDGIRRFAASQLVDTGVAQVNEVAAGFGINTESLRRWRKSLENTGLMGLAPVKKEPKRPSLLTQEKAVEIHTHRAGGASLRATAAATGVSTDTVRRAMAMIETPLDQAATTDPAAVVEKSPAQQELPLPPAPMDRSGERAAARAGLLQSAAPVFAPATGARHAGLFLAIPALEATGLLSCAKTVYSALPNGFYGLETVLIDAVLRALAGESRAEGATRFDPVELGRLLGMSRAPEVKTIRRKIDQLAQAGKAGDLIAALAAHHLKSTGPGGEEPGGDPLR
ncbi:putative transposase [Arthrobacter psychrolactophilus]